MRDHPSFKITLWGSTVYVSDATFQEIFCIQFFLKENLPISGLLTNWF